MSFNNSGIVNNWAAVTTSDTAQNNFVGLYVGVGGDVAIKGADGGTAITFKNLPTGALLPVSTSFVMATNTTATNILGAKP